MKKRVAVCLLAVCAVSLSAAAQKSSPQWIATFEASPVPFFQPPPGVPAAPAKPVAGTLRFRFGISVGGSQLIVKLSNEVGDKPLKIGGASIAIAGTDMNAVPGTLKQLTFAGKESIEIPAGMPVFSDPVQLRVDGMSDLLGTVYVPEPSEILPFGTSMLLTDGNQVSRESLTDARKVNMRPVITMVTVVPAQSTRVVVAMGDSITDASRENPSEPHGWVATLAGRMKADKKTNRLTAVSAGINGNQVLRTLMGTCALCRLDRDVLSVPGLSHVILLEGINDIGIAGKTPFGTSPPLAPEELIAGYQQIAIRAHLRGVKIFIGTLPPFEGSFYFSEEKEKLRQTINAWIRSSKDFDGVIDFDSLTRDPEHPLRLKAQFDSGDHLHPGPAGYKAMGDSIDLSLFK